MSVLNELRFLIVTEISPPLAVLTTEFTSTNKSKIIF